MKKNIFLKMIFILAVSLAVCGCATLEGVPQGSVPIGVYEGSFNGKFDSGNIQINLFRTPGGDTILVGSFSEGTQMPANFNGKLLNGKLEGTLLGAIDGTVSGELSSDRLKMSGTYKINDPPFDHGTWNALKK